MANKQTNKKYWNTVSYLTPMLLKNNAIKIIPNWHISSQAPYHVCYVQEIAVHEQNDL